MAKPEYLSLSKRMIDRLSVDDKDTVFWDRDLPGFGVRVYPSGAKVYVVQTRVFLSHYTRIKADNRAGLAPEPRCSTTMWSGSDMNQANDRHASSLTEPLNAASSRSA